MKDNAPGIDFMRIRDAVRTVVIKTNPYWPFSNLNKLPYDLAVKVFIQLCKKYREIDGIYLRAGLAEGHIIPALSDIDLTVIINSKLSLDQEFSFLSSFWQSYRRLKKLFPMLGEIEILNNEELGIWTKFGVPGYKAPSWKLIFGKEAPRTTYTAEPTRLTRDSLNYALWFYVRYFLEIFTCKEKSSYLISQDLKRLRSKIFRCLNSLDHAEATNKRVLDPRSSDIEMFSQILNSLDSAIRRFKVKDSPLMTIEWLPVRESDQLTRDSQFTNVSDLTRLNGMVQSVMANFYNKVFIVLRTPLDLPNLRSCLETFNEVFFAKHVMPTIVTASMFEYMLRHYEPFEYTHFMAHRKLLFGEDLLSSIQAPSRDSLVHYLLGRVPTLLTFMRSYGVNSGCSLTRELECMVEQYLFVKLYLEKGIVNPWTNEILAECQKHYPEHYGELRELTETGRSSRQWFSLLKRLSDEIHGLLTNSTKSFYLQ